MEVKIMKNIMSSNENIASENRRYFKDNGICVINIMASPGAGKTSIITKMIDKMRNDYDFFVIEGDIASSIDAEKIKLLDIPVLQINTGGGCHLDANMIKVAVSELNPSKNSILLIENVGNLICPSAFDLGENLKLVIASIPEGYDKPYKYTSMFEAADIVILNKMDLLNYFDFDLGKFSKGVKALNNSIPIFKLSCKDEKLEKNEDNDNYQNGNWDKLTDWLKEYLNSIKV